MKGKRSTFLTSMKSKNSGRSESRVGMRTATGRRSNFPNSSKVGAGANARVRRGYNVALVKARQEGKKGKIRRMLERLVGHEK